MTTETNNLWTRIKDLEAQLDAARMSMRDQFAMAALISAGEGAPKMAATFAYDYADAMMIERDKRNKRGV